MKAQSYIATIDKILPHGNADRLEIAHVRGWQSVVPKGQYTAGEKVVFVEIDSLIPRKPWNEFLFKGNMDKAVYRVCNAKLRGAPSQGIVFPLSVVNGYASIMEEGVSADDILGITKYEKPLPVCLSGISKGNFPTKYGPKTDEDNLMSTLGLMDELHHGEVLEATLKLDGSSCTVIVDRDGPQVCSRKHSLEEQVGNSFWDVVRRENVIERLEAAMTRSGECPIMLQGELCGPNIQENHMKLERHELFFFNARVAGRWLNPNEFKSFVRALGLLHVPVVGSIPTAVATIEGMQNMANGVHYPPGLEQRDGGWDSYWDSKHPEAEGLVFRPLSGAHSFSLGKPWSCKVINQHYKG